MRAEKIVELFMRWAPSERRQLYHKVILVVKCLRSLPYVDLVSYFLKSRCSWHKFNTRGKDMLILPRVNRHFGKTTFIFSGAYNSLLKEIGNLDALTPLFQES